MSHILVIDDDPSIQDVLTSILKSEGYEVSAAEDGVEGLSILKTEPIDVVFLDFRLPKKGGFEVLETIKYEWPNVEVIIISGHANVKNAVKAIKLGAYDYLEKPLGVERVLTIARNAIRLEALKRENAVLRLGPFLDEMVGTTEQMHHIREIVNQSAPSDSRVMILGENGTGKELVARMIHARSHRYNRSFVEVNCAAIPDNLIESELFGHEAGSFTGAVTKRRGKFEIADNGTLFLDEVADMSLDAQSKLLRVIQEMTFTRVGGETPIHVDVRIVAATNKDIHSEVKAGRFREDLYFRLNVIPLTVPPLRERRDDIPILIACFQKRLIAEKKNTIQRSFSPEAMQFLMNHIWPGNIRELKNFIERISVLADEPEISLEAAKYYLGEANPDMPASIPDVGYHSMELAEARGNFETHIIAHRLEQNNYNMAQTAQSLGMYPSNLHSKMKKYGIEVRK